jgi:hypothetical protein
MGEWGRGTWAVQRARFTLTREEAGQFIADQQELIGLTAARPPTPRPALAAWCSASWPIPSQARVKPPTARTSPSAGAIDRQLPIGVASVLPLSLFHFAPARLQAQEIVDVGACKTPRVSGRTHAYRRECARPWARGGAQNPQRPPPCADGGGRSPKLGLYACSPFCGGHPTMPASNLAWS